MSLQSVWERNAIVRKRLKRKRDEQRRKFAKHWLVLRWEDLAGSKHDEHLKPCCQLSDQPINRVLISNHSKDSSIPFEDAVTCEACHIMHEGMGDA